MADDCPWFAVMTKPSAEAKADADLRRQGYMTFFPFERVREKRKIPNRPQQHRIVLVDKPLFSRYLFVMPRAGQGLYAVNSTPSVSTVVCLGGQPLRIPDPTITALMDRCGEDGLYRHRDTLERKAFPSGATIRFAVSSPLAGLVAQVAEDMGKSVKVVLQMLGVEREVFADPAALEILSETT